MSPATCEFCGRERTEGERGWLRLGTSCSHANVCSHPACMGRTVAELAVVIEMRRKREAQS